MEALRYSLRWASGIVHDLEREYPRGTKILYDLSGQDHQFLTRLLAAGSPEWPLHRNLARFLQVLTRYVPPEGVTDAFLKQNLRLSLPTYQKYRRILNLDSPENGL